MSFLNVIVLASQIQQDSEQEERIECIGYIIVQKHPSKVRAHVLSVLVSIFIVSYKITSQQWCWHGFSALANPNSLHAIGQFRPSRSDGARLFTVILHRKIGPSLIMLIGNMILSNIFSIHDWKNFLVEWVTSSFFPRMSVTQLCCLRCICIRVIHFIILDSAVNLLLSEDALHSI